jgi:hypothetical protein
MNSKNEREAAARKRQMNRKHFLVDEGKTMVIETKCLVEHDKEKLKEKNIIQKASHLKKMVGTLDQDFLRGLSIEDLEDLLRQDQGTYG